MLCVVLINRWFKSLTTQIYDLWVLFLPSRGFQTVSKINSLYEGSCKAKVCYLVDDKTKCDYFDVLSLDIQFDTLKIEKDTLYYYFNFFDKSRNMVAFVLPTIDYQCGFVYAVGYIKNMKTPFKYLIAESTYSYYDIDIDPNEINRIFKKNFYSNDIKVNKWLISFVQKNPDLITEE